MNTPEPKIYLVGGAVRDQLLGLPVTDRDWVVVGGSAQAMRDRGFTQVGKDFPVFLHPQTKEEYALARRERKSGRGHTGFEFDTVENVTLEEDLMRRDLTINAMAQREDGAIVDPWGGREDLAAGVLRHVSPAFTEDPLRVLRVARFAARFCDRGFTIHDETLALMRAIATGGELETLPAARIWSETARALMEPAPAIYWQVLARCDAIDVLFPGIGALLDTPAHRSALPAAADTGAALTVRFALSLFGIGTAQQAVLLDRLQPPKDCVTLATAMNNIGMMPVRADAAELQAIFESLDYLRRPDQLEQFLVAQALLGTPQSFIERLRAGAAAMRNVDNRKLMQQGLSGKALGEALRDARRQVLETIL